MRILITGAAGFIGQIVAQRLSQEESNELILTDVIEPPPLLSAKAPHRCTCIKADLLDDVQRVVTKDLDAVIILHGIMSSGAEADLKLGYRVNVDATRSLLDALATKCPGVRVIYASSEAVYGRPPPAKGVNESTVTTPEMSYGCQKIICETIINDYTRRGLINGFSLRFPTVSIRPGKPTAAVTSFLSGIIREPMNGEVCVLPLAERDWKHWMCSPRTLVQNISIALSIPADALPPHRRAINVPGFAVTVQDMLNALAEVGGKEKLGLVREEPKPEMQSLLHSWADDYDNSLALSLGMVRDTSFVESIHDFMKTTSPT
nr:hypothetical protein B0A51_05779 [Rachicladosporium sp. CCFEE 5018]